MRSLKSAARLPDVCRGVPVCESQFRVNIDSGWTVITLFSAPTVSLISWQRSDGTPNRKDKKNRVTGFVSQLCKNKHLLSDFFFPAVLLDPYLPVNIDGRTWRRSSKDPNSPPGHELQGSESLRVVSLSACSQMLCFFRPRWHNTRRLGSSEPCCSFPEPLSRSVVRFWSFCPVMSLAGTKGNVQWKHCTQNNAANETVTCVLRGCVFF